MISLDGTFHTFDEELNDHPGGRCCPVPVTRTWSEITGKPVDVEDTSAKPWDPEESFKKLSEATQKRILGQTRYKLYTDGKINFSDFAVKVKDNVWGDYYRPKTIKELVKAGKITAEDVNLARKRNIVREWPGDKERGKEIPLGAITRKRLLSSVASAESVMKKDRGYRETLVAFDKQGKGIYASRVQGKKIDIPEHVIEFLDGGIITHSHTDGYSLSREDVSLACRCRLAQMRAVTHEYTYILTPPIGGWNEEYWERTLSELINNIDRELASKGIALKELAHRTYLELAKLGKIGYNRIR